MILSAYRIANSGHDLQGPGIRVFKFDLAKSTQCESRGVVETEENGTAVVRLVTVRRPGHEGLDGERYLIGDPLRQDYADAVRGLFRFEKPYMSGEMISLSESSIGRI
jgi:hypothetical protein